MLLAQVWLWRRADAVSVIGTALEAKAAGVGHRSIATGLGRPVSTVRGWLRRFAARAEQLRAEFTRLLVALDPLAAPVTPRASVFADALEAIGRAAAAAVLRLSPVSPWELAARATGRGAGGEQHELTLPPSLPGRAPFGPKEFRDEGKAMTGRDRPGDQDAARAERARDVALFRYALIRQAADASLSTKQRGALVRRLVADEHTGPAGQRVRVSRSSVDRWIKAWRTGGFDALLPSARHAEARTPAAVLELAAALKREVPARTAAQVAAILTEHGTRVVPSARTLQRHFARHELNTRPDGTTPRAFGRFEAAAPNERWTGDALHGPVIAGRKTYLMAFIDDHSRALVGYRWATARTRSPWPGRYAPG